MEKVIHGMLIITICFILFFQLGRYIERENMESIFSECSADWKMEQINQMVDNPDFEVLKVDVTAYSPSPNITAGNPFQMASGKIAIPQDLEQLKFVAISRDLKDEYNLKWGDEIWISFKVQDTMNARITNTVDIFMRNLELAKKWGRQNRNIIIRRK